MVFQGHKSIINLLTFVRIDDIILIMVNRRKEEKMADMKSAAFKAWETRYKEMYGFTDEEFEDFIEERYLDQLNTEDKKKVRDIVRYLGGIKDKDYEDIPIWARRKNGRALDEIAIELKAEIPERHIEEGEDVYNLLLEVSK